MEEKILQQMRADWDARARENARHFISNGVQDWEDRDFFRGGEINVANEVMPDMHAICGGRRSPLDLSALEIGCGVGRMTRMLARIFGHVTAVDVSGEMIERAKINLAGWDNATLIHGDGATLRGVADQSHDFAFSFIVFQHIPSTDVIASYCREVNRVLKPGSLFKFQVNGLPYADGVTPNTWEGVSFTEAQAHELCQSSGFLFEGSHGAASQYYWLLFRKPWATDESA